VTGPEHYNLAQEYANDAAAHLDAAEQFDREALPTASDRRRALGHAYAALAQVHATLALTAATAFPPRETTFTYSSPAEWQVREQWKDLLHPDRSAQGEEAGE